jgi:polyhydroxyalkanoate synthesis regulator phasin
MKQDLLNIQQWVKDGKMGECPQSKWWDYHVICNSKDATETIDETTLGKDIRHILDEADIRDKNAASHIFRNCVTCNFFEAG